jgi:hypothetical protein
VQPDPFVGSDFNVYSVKPFGPTRTVPTPVERVFTTIDTGFGVGFGVGLAVGFGVGFGVGAGVGVAPP